MTFRLVLGVALGVLTAGCGGKDVLSRDAFVQAARDCGARRAAFFPAPVKEDPPSIQVLDTVTTINGTNVSVPNCIAAKIKDFRYTQVELQAPPRSNR